MRTIRHLTIVVVTLTLLGFLVAAAEAPRRNDYILVVSKAEPDNRFSQQLVAVQGGTARTIADVEFITLFGTNGTEAGVMTSAGGPGDTISLVDLHDFSHVSKFQMAGAHTIPLHSSPNQALVLSD